MSLNKTDYELFEKYGYDKDDRRIIIAWLERIREDNNHKGESKPFPNRNNDAHIVALKNILLEKGFDQNIADKITLILEKGKDDDYTQLAFNSYALKTDLPSGWKKGDKVPDGIQKYSKDDVGNYNPIGGDDKKQGDEPPEVKPETNPNFNDDNIDGDHLTSKKKKSKKDKGAAEAVSTKSNRSAPQADESSTYLTESQVQAMSAIEYEKRSDEIMEAIRTGKFIYDISGSAR